jgi:hypothetical protein
LTVQTRARRGTLEHITGLNKAMPVYESLRNVAREGEKTSDGIGDTIKETEYMTDMSFPSFSYV